MKIRSLGQSNIADVADNTDLGRIAHPTQADFVVAGRMNHLARSLLRRYLITSQNIPAMQTKPSVNTTVLI